MNRIGTIIGLAYPVGVVSDLENVVAHTENVSSLVPEVVRNNIALFGILFVSITCLGAYIWHKTEAKVSEKNIDRLIKLVDKGQAYPEAIEVANLSMRCAKAYMCLNRVCKVKEKPIALHDNAFKLFAALVERRQEAAYPGAIAAAVERIASANASVSSWCREHYFMAAHEMLEMHVERDNTAKRLPALRIFEQLVERGYAAAFAAASTAAAEGVQCKGQDERSSALKLFEELFKRGYAGAFATATTAAAEGAASDNALTCVSALELFGKLVDRRHTAAFPAAIKAAVKVATGDADFSLSFLKNNDHEDHASARSSAFALFGKLLDRAHTAAYAAATAAAAAGLRDDYGWVRSSALELFEKLFDGEYAAAFEAATTAAAAGVQRADEWASVSWGGYGEKISYAGVRSSAIELFGKLFERGHAAAFEAATTAAARDILSTDRSVRESAIELFGKLFERGHAAAFEAATTAAAAGIQNDDGAVRESALALLGQLVKQGHAAAFSAATIAAEVAATCNDPNERMQALYVFEVLVQREHTPAYKSAIVASKAGVGSKNEDVRAIAQRLLEKLGHKEHKERF